jgi:peroxiredoxin Q/BCP
MKVSLADLVGKWVVLYFYPKDNTPGCTREAVGFQEAQAAFKRAGAVVVGISRDSVESHVRFKQTSGLDFVLLSDPTAATHEAYGAFGEKNLYGKKTIGAIRTTVLVRPDGTIARVFPNVKVNGHTEAVLHALDEAKAR